MKYGVYFLDATSQEWVLILKGLSYAGAIEHAVMYKRLFKAETKVVEEA